MVDYFPFIAGSAPRNEGIKGALMLPALNQLLQFEHPQVVRSFVRDHRGDEKTARELFENMLKYLWLSNKHLEDKKQNPKDESLQFTFVMHEEMRQIDNMWHNFILYTNDYTDFCQRYFGEYLHHVPDVADKMQQTEEEFKEHMEKYLSYVYDNLGEETVRSWFADHV